MLRKRPIPALKGWQVLWCKRGMFTSGFLKWAVPSQSYFTKKIPYTESLQKTSQTQQKIPKQQNHKHKKLHTPGNRLKAPKNSSLNLKKYLRQLPQQADWGYNGHRPWHAGPFVPPHPVKSELQNRSHPTRTALRTQKGVQIPRPTVWYFHQDHEINYYSKKGTGS